MRRLVTLLSLGTVGCGDCVSLGYPSATVIAADASTRAKVSLASASFVVIANGRPPLTSTLPSDWSSNQPYEICCSTGPVRIQLVLAGYAPLDTTLDIRSTGSCRIPEHVDAVLLLKRAQTGVALTVP